jgi:CDP-diacylglycerol--glycerol-3-phosphate 3-phosphatidyltransferase
VTALRHELRLLPNQLTATRLLLLPALWACALLGHGRAVGIGLAACFLLDWGDGYAARRLGVQSAFGSKFDSIVDGAIVPSAIAWILLLEPRALLDDRSIALTWFVLTYASLAVGLVKFRRFANLHLRSSRVACVFQYAFVVDALAAPPYEQVLLYAAAACGIASSLETLVLQLVRLEVDEHLGSILLAARRGS